MLSDDLSSLIHGDERGRKEKRGRESQAEEFLREGHLEAPVGVSCFDETNIKAR